MSLIVKLYHRLPSQLLYAGDEVPPGLLEQDAIDLLLDAGVLGEIPTRLSYFALLHSFSESSSIRMSSDSGTPHPFPELVIPLAKLDAPAEQA